MYACLQTKRAGNLSIQCARLLSRPLCCVLILMCLPRCCVPQSRAAFTPNDLEAAYLFKFGQFVQWPADAALGSQSFSICTLGEDPFGKKLDDLVANETLQGRKIVPKRLSAATAADSCQILFIGESEEPRLAKDLAAVQGKPVLTVSSLPGFLDRGGMILFLVQNNRVRFAVNLPAAQQAGLQLSSEFLKVAVYVNTKAVPEVAK